MRFKAAEYFWIFRFLFGMASASCHRREVGKGRGGEERHWELESFGVEALYNALQCLAELETFGGYSQRGGGRDSWRELFFKSVFHKCWVFFVELCSFSY